MPPEPATAWRSRAPAAWVLSVILPVLVAVPCGAQDGPVIQPGFGLGGSVGVNGFGGSASREIDSATGWEPYLSYTLAGGLSLRAGASLGGHDLPPEVRPWRFVSFHLEPRYVALGLSDRFAPFVAGRVGYATEQVVGPSYEFKASGTLMAAGAGVLIRLVPQAALEVGVLAGTTRFDSYRFAGEFAWKECLDGLEAGTPLPRSVSACAGSRSQSGVVRLCYPPYFPDGTSTSHCSPPEIPYEDTGRSASWLRTYIGLSLTFSDGRGGG